MAEKTHILLIEDDKDVSRMLQLFLEEHHYAVSIAHQYADIEPALVKQAPDLVILDLHIPGGKTGVDVCRELRQHTSVPIIVLTGEERDMDKVLLLELGADNYLTKPMDPSVLLSYLRAALRRAHEEPVVAAEEGVQVKVFHDVLEFDRFVLNTTTRSLYDREGRLLPLKPAEYTLLCLFLRSPGQVLSRDRLLDLKTGGIALDRSIDTLVSRIRHCIESDPKHPVLLQTYRNGGYLLQATVVKKRIECKP
ncbi:MAG: hypothetical protein A3J38_05830 [Gammaproteobacteria bacterium RIFCSPHIGHO2_12_FULL_45_9]|nr:MAG: hypothetical protein A3J38_05830 [Gammaproteobacteria bacterium RIFCSPHIGHO2_12_FULL_45_9]